MTGFRESFGEPARPADGVFGPVESGDGFVSESVHGAIESTAYTVMQANLSGRVENRKAIFHVMGDMPTKTKGERIKFVRKLNRLTQEAFANVLGASRGAVGNWELGKGIATDNLESIAQRFRVDLGWLMTGKGIVPSERIELPHIESSDVLMDDTLPELVGGSIGISTVKPYVPKLPNASPVVAARLGAGGGGVPQTMALEHNGIAYSADAVLGEIVLPPTVSSSLSNAPTNRIHWFEVRGDSMEPTLRGGDWVGVNTTDIGTRAGGVFALRTSNGEIIVKRIRDQGDGGRIEIVSDNPQQGNYHDNLNAVVVFGRVVARISRVG